MLTLDTILRATRQMTAFGEGQHFFDGRNDRRATRKREAVALTEPAAAPAVTEPPLPKEEA